MLERMLDDLTHGRIASLSEKGNALAEAGDLAGAFAAYQRALELVPEPVYEWEASTWLFVAMGDLLFQQHKFREAGSRLSQAMHCPGALGNPFIHLRLGQVHYELQEYDRARGELARAYMGGGDEIFKGEHPKYHDYIRESLRPQADSL